METGLGGLGSALPVNLGGSLNLDGFGDSVTADIINGIPSDAAAHNENLAVTGAVPSWYTNAGQITEEGLYVVAIAVTVTGGHAFTTAATLVKLSNVFNAVDIWSAAEIAVAGAALVATDTMALVLADLPLQLTAAVQGEADATGQVSIHPTIYRLAH